MLLFCLKYIYFKKTYRVSVQSTVYSVDCVPGIIVGASECIYIDISSECIYRHIDALTYRVSVQLMSVQCTITV